MSTLIKLRRVKGVGSSSLVQDMRTPLSVSIEGLCEIQNTLSIIMSNDSGGFVHQSVTSPPYSEGEVRVLPARLSYRFVETANSGENTSSISAVGRDEIRA